MNGGFAMRRWRRIACWALLAGLVLSAGCGTPPAADEPAERSPYRAEFDQLFDVWRSFLDELRQVRKEYAAGEPEQRQELTERYDQMVKKGNALESQVVQAAVDAYVKEPEENEDLAFFLMDIARTLLAMEEYEDALRMSQILVDNKVGDYSAYYCAAIAAFAVGEFDVSERRQDRDPTGRQEQPVAGGRRRVPREHGLLQGGVGEGA